MRREDWLALVDVLHLPVCCYPHFKLLSKRFGYGALKGLETRVMH